MLQDTTTIAEQKYSRSQSDYLRTKNMPKECNNCRCAKMLKGSNYLRAKMLGDTITTEKQNCL